MNKPLSLVLLSALGDLPYIDKKTGVVQLIEKPVNVSGETIFKKIPVSTLATSQECGAADLSAVDLIPDAKYKGLLYFEEKGSSIGVRRSSTQQYKSDLRLVCWLNTLRINGGVPDMLLAAKAMNQIIQILTGTIPNSSPFINIGVAIARIPEANSGLFPYDYDEKRTQYLFSPYDFFAIDLSVSFDLARNCKPDIVPIDPPTC